VEPDLAAALRAAARDGAERGVPLYAIPTYTAMLELRELLMQRGEANSSWR
jgi:lipid II isoglutaminyl synthase (glutamine-hydrolysing)